MLNILDEKMKCYYCNPNIMNKVKLAKQNQVKYSLESMGLKACSYDKRLDNGTCGNERPDFVFISKDESHYVVLEVDENQHSERAEECECTRMVNISQSLGMPTIFIRYNPDEYKVRKQKIDPSHNTRMKVLKRVLDTVINLKVNQLIGYCVVRYLYFDNWNISNTNYDIITKFV
jgi:hypothetical protein